MGHDQLFKDLLRAFFGDFVRLFFPDKARRLDLGSVSFEDKEVFTDLPRGRERRLDLVVKVRTNERKREIVLVHIEVESRSRRDFHGRMHEYYMALRLRHRCPVFPIALVLSRAEGGLDRPTHREEVLGDEVDVFRYWRIGLPKLDGASYVGLANPLAPALAALMKPGSPARARWKLECMAALRRIRVDEARRRLLVDCIETYLTLNAREETEFDRLVHERKNKEVRQMRKTWSEQLMERGEARGRKIGQKLGQKLGQQVGELRAKRETLLALMRAKYGPLPGRVTKEVAAIENRRRLDTLLRRVLTAHTLEEMGL